MKFFSQSVVAGVVLVTMVNVAEGATAGHMLKSTIPAANSDQDATGSINKPSAANPDITGSIKKKHRAKNPGATGSITPKSNSGQ